VFKRFGERARRECWDYHELVTGNDCHVEPLSNLLRRAPSVDALIPALYLKGISTGDFSEALTAILGEGASGLSATNIVRLKSSWETDYKLWCQRDLSQKRYVYWWADGLFQRPTRRRANLCAGLDRSH
jgi:transposase-like protein